MSPDGSETTSTDAELAVRRARMVERQLRRRGIRDERVLAAMGDVPRELFVPEALRDRAYRDGALPIAEGQTISQPWIVARMIELLELEGPERVLEVGTGSGYCGRRARPLRLARGHRSSGIERSREAARALARAAGVRNVELRVGDGSRRSARPDAVRRHLRDGVRLRQRASGGPARPGGARRGAGLPGRPRWPGAPAGGPRRPRAEDRPRPLRPAGRGRPVKSEHSAGGLVVRSPRGPAGAGGGDPPPRRDRAAQGAPGRRRDASSRPPRARCARRRGSWPSRPGSSERSGTGTR